MPIASGNRRTPCAPPARCLLLGTLFALTATADVGAQMGDAASGYAGKSAAAWAEVLARNLDGESKDAKESCQQAARALGQIGPPAAAAVPLLARAIAATAVDVRRPAIDALGRIGPAAREAVPAIIAEVDLPKDHINYAPLTHFRRLAARALGRIGPDASAAIPLLERALTNEDHVYRVEAALALWRIAQYPRALETLEAVIRENHPEGPYEAVMTIPKLGLAGRAATRTLVIILKHPNPDLRRAAASVLVDFGPGVLPPVATLLKNDTPKSPEAAAYVLGELFDQLRREVFDHQQMDTATLGKAARPVLQTAAPALVQLLSDQRDEVRQVAIQSLSRLGLLGVHVLLPVLNNPDQRTRQAAIEALARLEAFLPDQWPTSEGMELIKSRQIEPLMSLMQGAEPEPRLAAFRIFDQLRFGAEGREAIPLLRNALRDKNVSIRRYAFEALQRVGEPQSTQTK